MASGVYNRFKANLLSGLADLNGSGAHTIKCGLMTSTHSFVAANRVWTAVSANETSGTNYVAGGTTLTTLSVTQDDSANNWGSFTAANASWASSTITAAHAVLYDNTLIAKDLICSFDFGGNQSSSNGTFTIQWNANGIVTLS